MWKLYWKVFNFLARRVVAVGFIIVGAVIAMSNLHLLLPGKMILVNGVPSDDLVLRLAAVVFPLLVAALGLAMYRAKPFEPATLRDRDGDA